MNISLADSAEKCSNMTCGKAKVTKLSYLGGVIGLGTIFAVGVGRNGADKKYE